MVSVVVVFVAHRPVSSSITWVVHPVRRTINIPAGRKVKEFLIDASMFSDSALVEGRHLGTPEDAAERFQRRGRSCSVDTLCT